MALASISTTVFSENENIHNETQAPLSEDSSSPIQFHNSYILLIILVASHGHKKYGGTIGGICSVAILTFSIIAHEFGHKAMIKKFSEKEVPIHLVATGGYVEPPKDHYFSPVQNAWIAAAGPIVNLLLLTIGYLGKIYLQNTDNLIRTICNITLDLNKGFFLLNSAPFLVTDGGHFVVESLEAIDNKHGRQTGYLVNFLSCAIFFIFSNSYFYQSLLLLGILLSIGFMGDEQKKQKNILKAKKLIVKEEYVAAEKKLLKLIKMDQNNQSGLKASYILAKMYQKQHQENKAYQTLLFYENHLEGAKASFFKQLKQEIQ